MGGLVGLMIPDELKKFLLKQIDHVDHPRELAVDVMFAIQDIYGCLTDEGVQEAAQLLDMSPLEIEQLATFYTFIYREPVGKYVIHVCDSVVCWMNGYESVRDYLCRKLAVQPGETTADGLFTLLTVCCIGYCDRSPAMLINGKAYGNLTADKIDAILQKLKVEA
ncbi:MAG: NADH-quinone oxidoreductase subunit NuoE [Desulfobacterales bacterium]